MADLETYSADYDEARRKFRSLASSAGANLETFPISVTGFGPSELTIDVASVGDPAARRLVVVSSGVHGVEGYFGAAIQLAWLRQIAEDTSKAQSPRVLLIHGINPYGFRCVRRANENNVDLNRNFLLRDCAYRGCPNGYAELNRFLNPFSAPSQFEPFKVKVLWNIWRRGLPAIKAAVAGGQYEFPQGLFFGGHCLAESSRLIVSNFQKWVGSARHVVHIDFHSGLGAFAEYKLLLVESSGSRRVDWYRDTFDAEQVEPLNTPDGTAYVATGVMGDWLARSLTDCDYRFVAAEVGTYRIERVLGALRAENRAHFYCAPGSPKTQRAKQELMECFCPAAPAWRELVLERGHTIIEQAIQADDS